MTRINPFTGKPADRRAARAAPPWFPYQHRTLAEIDAKLCPVCRERTMAFVTSPRCLRCCNTGRSA